MISQGAPARDLPSPALPFVAGETASSTPPALVAEILAAAKAAGATFYERVTDGELIAHGLEALCPDLRAVLEAQRGSIRSVLLPAGSTASIALLERLGVELIFVNDEQLAAREVRRLCAGADTLGIDVETTPRPEFLPVLRPITITKDGHPAKTQPVLDTSAALDPFRAEVRLLQVAAEIDGRMAALVIDLRRVPLGSGALVPIWKCTLVGHNLSFDSKMLLANGVALDDANLLDTILMSGLVLRGIADRRREGTRRPSLKAAVHEALEIELPKGAQVSPWWRDRLTDEQVAYAALDTVFALKLASALQPRIDALPRGREALSRLCGAVVPVALMELAGITLDRDGLARQAGGWDEELIGLKAEIAEIGIANPSSGPQVAAWLKSGLECLDAETGSNWLATWPRTESGALSTKAKHLKRLNSILPGAELLVRYSALAQLGSNFGDKLLARISPHTGRLHGNFLIAAAKSGRFSSSKPNLQNIPKSEAMRSLFVAAPGKVLVVADYSQLELRVMAAIAGDRVMTEAYRNGLDLHAVTAAGMLGIGPEEFDPANPAHKAARQKAKAVNFGVIYGSGPGGLREFARDAYGVLMSLDEAQHVIDRFLATYPGVARWQREQADRSRMNRTAATIGGRVYRFAWEPNGEYARNLALNLPVQGTAAEIALEATIRIGRRLRSELGGRDDLVLQVHDEFVVEADDEAEVVTSVKRVLEQEMSAAFAALLPDAPLTGLVDAHAGPNWAEAKG
ncbi:DNA polymerase [Methylobacterium nigriterrae]|uniref:DNA polymerase n=1 Tax=Methylobacterium nigriterrae TaxID=3127512 RepID=UPI0030139DB1